MAKSVIKLIASLLVICGLMFIALYGLDFTDSVGIPGVLDEDGIVQGLDLKGGSVIVFKAQADNPSDEDMESVVSMLRTRLDGMGYTEATLTRQGADKVRIEIPSVSNPEDAIESLGATAQLKFVDYEGNEIMTGADVVNAVAQYGSTSEMGRSQHYIELEFSSEGTKKFAEATGRIAALPSGQNYIAIMMDDMVISAPSVAQKITSEKCVIEGADFTAEETKALASNIKSGKLPFSLEQVEMRSISATLGDTALASAVKAGIIGAVLVMLFMLLVYRLPGLMADIALLFYIAVVLILCANLHINLTLPGIAGIILAVGMAIDANVVIFERIKEELKLGKTVRSAVDAGFNRAFSAIIDSNVTTIISALILYFLGTGTIKGFGSTLFIGIVVSMISAIFVTKFLLKQMIGLNVKQLWLYGINKNKTKKEGTANV